MPLTLVSRAIAFTVPVLLAQWYGVSSEMDAFYYAIGIPTFLLVVGASAVGSVLVPTLAAAKDGGRVLGGAALWSALAASALGLTFALSLKPVLALSSDFEPATVAQTQTFCLRLIPFLAAVAINSALRAATELQGKFAASALSPLVRTVALLSTAMALRAEGAAGLPFAMAVGAGLEALWLLGVLWPTPLRPVLSAWPRELGPAVWQFAPVLVGETLVALNIVVDKLFAASLEAGSVSLLEYADRARVIPMTLFEGTLLVVAFNTWAREAPGARPSLIRRSLSWVLLVAPPVLAGLYFGRSVAVSLLFERGVFLPEHVAPVAAAFGAFLPGVFFGMLAALAVKAHLLAGRVRLVLALGVFAFACNATLNVVLLPWGISGLALATSLTSAAVATISLVALWPSLPPGRWPIVVLTLSVLAALSLGWVPAPVSMLDPSLWAAALLYVGLLTLGVMTARRLP